MPVQSKKTFKPKLLRWGMVVCLFLTGCRDKPASHYYHRGSDYMIEEEYDQAILCFDKAIKINPRSYMAYFGRGNAYFEKGKFDLAISDYTKGIEIAPGHYLLHNNRSVAYYHKGEYDKAWEDVHKAQSSGLKVQPEFLKNLREASGREK
jgi:tetratricopeptide (TPR) repeat protein